MKRTQRLWFIGICAIAFLVCVFGGPQRKHVLAQTQTFDDNVFTIYASIDSDSNNNIYVDTFGPTEDVWEVFIDSFEVIGEPEWELSDGESGEGYSLQFGPVPPGNTYSATVNYTVQYFFNGQGGSPDGSDDCGELGECSAYDNPTGYVSIDIPFPPPQISNISPHFDVQGASGTIHVQGKNLQDSSGTLNAYFRDNDISVSVNPGATASNADLSYSISPTALIGAHQLVLQNSGGESEPATFTVNSAPAPPPPADPCAVTSSPQVGFTSIVPTGTASGVGTMAVSFSGPNFSALTPSVTYGPYSTPESIAAHMAALITQNYIQYGLSAKAFGPNIVYNGLTTLGTVTNVATGSSYTTNTSSTAATAAGIACYAAPKAPALTVETTVVAWIDGKAITLPSGASGGLTSTFLPGGPPKPVNILSEIYRNCALQVQELAAGSLGSVSNTAADKAYANAWLLKYSANQDPGPSINPTTFAANPSQYRLFNDYEPSAGSAIGLAGGTPDPCGSPLFVLGDSSSPYLDYSGTSISGYQYHLAEGRVGSDGQAGWATLNGEAIPWIWSLIEFDRNGKLVNYGNKKTVPCDTPTSVNYQIFPTYSVYVTPLGATTGSFLTKINQGTISAFASLPPGQSLVPSCIP
jgi:hypothetical protein